MQILYIFYTTDNSRSNRLDRVRTRGWVRVGEVAAPGVATDDAVIGDWVAKVLHADGVIAVVALGGVGDVGSWGEGLLVWVARGWG